METKSFDPAVLAGLTTGIVLTDDGFSPMHEAAEWVMGHPIWTHQFPTMLPAIRDAIVAQFADMPTEAPDDFMQAAVDVRARYGKAVEVRRGAGETAINPLDPKGFPEAMRKRKSEAPALPRERRE